AASRRLDHEHIALLHVGRPGRAQFEPAAVRADDIGLARLTRFAAFQAKRCDPPAISQDGRSHGFEEAHASYTAVAAAGLATPTAAFTNDVAFQQDRETPLQHFGIREARVRHVRLHDIGPVEVDALAVGAAQDARTRTTG